MVAVLALYRARADAFTRDDLSILQALGSKVGLALENALKDPGKDSILKAVASAAHAGAD